MRRSAAGYFLVINGQGFGPFPLQTLKQFRAAGIIDGSALAWQPRMLEPVALSQLLRSPPGRYPARPAPLAQRLMVLTAFVVLALLVALVVIVTPDRFKRWAVATGGSSQEPAESVAGEPSSPSHSPPITTAEPTTDRELASKTDRFQIRYHSSWPLGNDELLSLAVSTDSPFLAVGSAAAELIVWNYETQRRHWRANVDGKRVFGVGFSSDQRAVHAADGRKITKYHVANGLLIDQDYVISHDSAWFSDSGEFAAVYQNLNNTPSFAFYQLSPFRKLSETDSFVSVVAFSDQQAVYGAKTLYKRDFEYGVPAKQIADGGEFELGALAVTPVSNRLALGFERGNGSNIDSRVYLQNLISGTRVPLVLEHREYLHALAFSADGRYLASAGGGTLTDRHATRQGGDCDIRIWDLRSEQVVGQLSGLDSAARKLIWLNDHRTLVAIAYGSPTVYTWTLPLQE
jgi:WD40 repeat protein